MNRITSIIWFRQDLRIEDNAAIEAAIARGGAVIPVYVWTPEEQGDWSPGSAARWWLRHSLLALSSQLESVGSRLIVREGDPARALSILVKETGATDVYFNRRYEPAAAASEAAVTHALGLRGVDVHPSNDSLLFDPREVRNRSGQPFKVFTPFWKHLLSLEDPGRRIPAPEWIAPPAQWPACERVAGLGFLRRPDETLGLHLNWSPGEVGAREALIRFMDESLGDYGRGRDLPGIRGTSRLSPRLHFGEIGPRRVWYEITRTGGADGESYLRQLAWREFSYHLLHHYPDAATTPMRKSFERFPWIDAPGALRAWQEGRTGYPIVDAGMRELLATGWMHNRVRMVAASFLVKHLMIHWTEGVKWFWERLVDADLANNTMGWQCVAGSGAAAAPYFRVFNPVTQGRKFDPDGNYVRTWVPELA
jgi:deoxyribodipyrimidine photo-lyase